MNTSKIGKLLPCSRYFFAWVCHHYRSWRIRWCRRHLYFHLGTRYSGPNVSFSEFLGLIIHFKNHLCLAYPWRWCLQRSWKWLSWWLFRTVCRTRRAYPRSRCCFPHNEHTSKSCLWYLSGSNFTFKHDGSLIIGRILELAIFLEGYWILIIIQSWTFPTFNRFQFIITKWTTGKLLLFSFINCWTCSCWQ